MPDILAIDTYADDCHVALLGGQSDVLRTASEPRSHASQLALFAQSILADAEHPAQGILVVAGPGSYTGLRIGVSTAKGLAWSMDLPLYAISTLHYLALSAEPLPDGSQLVVAIKARADEVFTARFRVEDGLPKRISPDAPMMLDDFRNWLGSGPSDTVLVVDHPQVLGEMPPDSFEVREVKGQLRSLRPFLSNLLNDFRVNDLNSFEPAYLKEFVARKASKSIFERLPF
jgi:tRNA threonylcarbamoyladenosine biosynthesis protein TsaB